MELKLVPVEETRKPLCDADIPIRKDVLDQMFKIMYENKGIGLAAPQVGWYQRFFIGDMGSGKTRRFVCCNPKLYVPRKARAYWSEEGCLSVPGERRIVQRVDRVKLRGFDENGTPFDWTCIGRLAQVVAHEMDHLNGRCIVDELAPGD